MAGLKRSGGARRARRSADPILVEQKQQHIPFDSGNADTDNAGGAAGTVSVQIGFRNAQQSIRQTVAQPCNMSMGCLHSGAGQTERLCHADNARHIFRTCAAASFLSAAPNQRYRC